MTSTRRHDIAVIGGGPGGYAVAFRAAARGLDVAVVEEASLGGTCLHRGCIPSKAVLYVAQVLTEVHRAEVLGLKLSFDGIDGDGLSAFRDGVVARLHAGLESLVGQRATLYRGRGRMATDTSGVAGVEVTDADGEVIRVDARHVVLATGSVPRELPGVRVDGEVVQNSDQALRFTTPPEHAVIIGAGAIGMEFASMWEPMGSQVTVVEAMDRVLPSEDADSSAAVTAAYRRRGIDVVTSARVEGIEVEDARATLHLDVAGEPRTVHADRVLVAVGRDPNTAGTGAAELDVLDDRGFVATDPYGQTSVDGVWAVGDVRPTLALAHAAFAEGFVVADRVAGVPTPPVDHTQTPRVTYCHPEVASVGLTEAEARGRHGEGIAVTTYPFKANAKGIIAGAGDGHVKVVHAGGPAPVGAPQVEGAPGGKDARPAAGAVLGVHVVGPHATELIGEATLATSWEAVPAELAAITHAHPSLYEAMGEAFQSAAGLAFHGH